MAKMVIQYTRRNVNAGTEYRRPSLQDKKAVLDYFERAMVRMDDLCGHEVDDVRKLADGIWRTPTSRLPYGRTAGKNSYETMTAGILANMKYDEAKQDDFSKPQCDAIETMSKTLNEIFDEEFPEIKFEKK
jgi:hypothetical protein